MVVQKLNEETLEPEFYQQVPVGPQSLTFHVDWPLSGMAGWISQPTEDHPWKLTPEELFDLDANPSLDCDGWLGQQVVIFDRRGITLRDIVRVIANTEAAHSPPMDRLMVPAGTKDRSRHRVVDDVEIHILGSLTVFGVRYVHALVMEAAIYLYNQLVKKASNTEELDEGWRLFPIFGFCWDRSVFSSEQQWLRFGGGLIPSLGGSEQSIAHRLRAPTSK